MDTALTILAGILVAVATANYTSQFYVHQATADRSNVGVVNTGSIQSVQPRSPAFNRAAMLHSQRP